MLQPAKTLEIAQSNWSFEKGDTRKETGMVMRTARGKRRPMVCLWLGSPQKAACEWMQSTVNGQRVTVLQNSDTRKRHTHIRRTTERTTTGDSTVACLPIVCWAPKGQLSVGLVGCRLDSRVSCSLAYLRTVFKSHSIANEALLTCSLNKATRNAQQFTEKVPLTNTDTVHPSTRLCPPQ